MPERKRQKLQERLDRDPKPVVFEIVRDSKCSECGVELPSDSLLFMEADQPLCLACAGMADLEYLGAGDAALTRRSTKYSSRSAVVVRFSRSRGRYERQGSWCKRTPWSGPSANVRRTQTSGQRSEPEAPKRALNRLASWLQKCPKRSATCFLESHPRMRLPSRPTQPRAAAAALVEQQRGEIWMRRLCGWPLRPLFATNTPTTTNF